MSNNYDYYSPPVLPPRPPPPASAQGYNAQDGEYYHHHTAPPPPPLPARPFSTELSYNQHPYENAQQTQYAQHPQQPYQARHSLPPPPPPPPPRGAYYSEKPPGFSASQSAGRRRWVPQTKWGKCLLWTLCLGILGIIVAVVAVAVTLSNRNNSSNSSNGNSGGGSGGRPKEPLEPSVTRVPADYSENHPLSPAQGGINTSGELPVYGNRSIDHFVIHFNRTTALTRLDPIVSPGNVSQHAHRFLGASYIQPNLVFRDELVAKANCSTVPVQDDKSQYWMPQLYHRFSNGSFIAIPVKQASVYYFQKAPTKDKIYPYPDNYNVVAGNPNRRFVSANDTGGIIWNCYRGGGNDISGPGFPNSPCPDGLIQIITFPSCWDGVRADDGKYRDHVAFPTDSPNGWRCPSAFPYKFITLQYEMIFDVAVFPYNGNGQTWILANGDTTGYGAHADFVNGWHPATMQAVTEVCRYMNATTGWPTPQEPRNCPALNRTYNAPRAIGCRLQTQIVNEDVGLTPIARLPGCNEVWTGNGSKPTCSDNRVESGAPDLVDPRVWSRNEPYV